jgi:hypothetical protein
MTGWLTGDTQMKKRSEIEGWGLLKRKARGDLLAQFFCISEARPGQWEMARLWQAPIAYSALEWWDALAYLKC